MGLCLGYRIRLGVGVGIGDGLWVGVNGYGSGFRVTVMVRELVLICVLQQCWYLLIGDNFRGVI